MSKLHHFKVKAGKLRGFFAHPRNPMTEGKAEAAEQLKTRVGAMSPISTNGLNDAGRKWAEHSNELRDLCLNEDPDRFLTWGVIRRTMFVDSSRFLTGEYQYLSRLDDFDSRWLPAATESWVGSPPRFWMNGATSGNRIHAAYHLARYEAHTTNKITDFDSIVEFGGGYGCLCDTIHKLGFKGKYVIKDMPFQSALQRYFLTRNGRKLVEPNDDSAGISLCDNDDDFEQVVGSLKGKRLFIATWSLSETPLEYRRQADQLTMAFEGHLIAYQQNFEQVDNIGFFEKWQSDRPHLQFSELPIPHLKGSAYLFGQ